MVNLVVSQDHRCEYCFAVHTDIAGVVGFTPEQIIDIRQGRASFDAKLYTLARLDQNMALERGHADPTQVDALLAADWTLGHLVDVIVVIGDMTMTKYLYGSTLVSVDFPPAPALPA